MSTETITTDVTQQEFDDLIGKLMRGEPRDPKEIKQSRERMDYMREEIRKTVGTVEVAVDFIRELRALRSKSFNYWRGTRRQT